MLEAGAAPTSRTLWAFRWAIWAIGFHNPFTFAVQPGTGTATVLASFNGANGDNPEAALALAIERGGDDARKRARADADFDAVRAMAWFQKLVTP